MLDRYAPGVRVIGLLHDARPIASALRAPARRARPGAAARPRLLGVVDPGVGSDRGGSCSARTDAGTSGRTRPLLGDRRASPLQIGVAHHRASAQRVAVVPGRDIFAPMAAAIATDDFQRERRPCRRPRRGPRRRRPRRSDLRRPLRELLHRPPRPRPAGNGPARRRRPRVSHARVFAEASPATVWYVNSSVLVGSVNRGRRARARVGEASAVGRRSDAVHHGPQQPSVHASFSACCDAAA